MSNVKVGKQLANVDMIFDWKATPDVVMEAVAKRLAVFGFVVTSHASVPGDDEHGFCISKKKDAKKQASRDFVPGKDKLVVGNVWHQYAAVVTCKMPDAVEVQFRHRGQERLVILNFGHDDTIPRLGQSVKVRWYSHAKQWMMVPGV